MGFMEILFTKPTLYKLKRRITFLFGEKRDLNLDKYIVDKAVLNLGCGPAISPISLEGARLVVGIDVSEKFIREAVNRDSENIYCVADAIHLPFPDKKFDITVIFGVLHHISEDTNLIIKEIIRVTKEKIILIEPLQSESGIPRLIKTLWWRFTDGGSHYYTKKEWDKILKDFSLVEEQESGRLFKNNYLFVGKLKNKLEHFGE